MIPFFRKGEIRFAEPPGTDSLAVLRKMKEQLFLNAYDCILAASDFMNYVEDGQSFLYDEMIKLGFSKEEADQTMMTFGSTMLDRASIYMECFDGLGVEPEYDEWSQREGQLEAAKARLIQSVGIADGILAHPDLAC